MNSLKRIFILTSLLLLCSVIFQFEIAAESKKIVLGVAQVGAESDWRIANTRSIKEAAESAGIVLKFVDGQQKQENQIKAIKKFIAQKVDVIAFSPVVVTGWDEVLQSAKEAGIPVILLDRSIKVKDESLWLTSMGSDFKEEGRRAANWLIDYGKKSNWKGQINILELQGNVGADPAIERKIGFEEIIKKHPNYKIIISKVGDFREALGREIVESILKTEKRKIHVIFSHNDNMALGAIEAIENFGLRPGKDITIVSVDAIKAAFHAMIAGKLNCTVECSPLLGPQLMQVVKDIVAGKKVDRRIVTKEDIFPAERAKEELPKRQY